MLRRVVAFVLLLVVKVAKLAPKKVPSIYHIGIAHAFPPTTTRKKYIITLSWHAKMYSNVHIHHVHVPQWALFNSETNFVTNLKAACLI